MDDLRDSFSRLKKDVKHRLGKSKRKGDKPGAGGREESVGSSASFPQPEPQVSMGGGSEREGDEPNTGNENVGASSAADENKPGWKSTASSSAKLVLRAVRIHRMPSAHSSPSLEVYASFWKIARYDISPYRLSVSLTCPQRTKANEQAIESLAPRVKELAERLCKPVHEGDVEEGERRTRLEQ